MNNYFDSEITTMERELRQLKTAAVKSAANVETIAKTVQISVPLEITPSQTYCRGNSYYKITCDHNAIVMITLDWYHTDITVEWQSPRITRSLVYNKCKLSDGSIGIEFRADGTNNSDYNSDLSKLNRGESVVVTANMTVRATDNFTVEQINV